MYPGKKNKLEDDIPESEEDPNQMTNNLLEEAKNKIKNLREANENALNFLKRFNMTAQPFMLNKTIATRNVDDQKPLSFKEKMENLQRNLMAYRNSKVTAKKPLETPVEKTQPNQNQEEIYNENIKDVFGEPPSQERASMPLADYLKKPFMGLPSKQELTDFFQENGDDLDLLSDAGDIVGSANPKMVEPIVESPPSAIVDATGNVYALLNDVKLTVGNDDQRSSVTIPKHLLKPYMGKFKKKHLESDNYYGLYSKK